MAISDPVLFFQTLHHQQLLFLAPRNDLVNFLASCGALVAASHDVTYHSAVVSYEYRTMLLRFLTSCNSLVHMAAM